MAFTAEHFIDNYGLKPSEFTVRPVTTPGTGANFSAQQEEVTIAEKAQHSLDEAIKAMLPDVLNTSGDFIKKVENAIQSATSLDEAELALVELLAPRMPGQPLVSLDARRNSSFTAARANQTFIPADAFRGSLNIR